MRVLDMADLFGLLQQFYVDDDINFRQVRNPEFLSRRLCREIWMQLLLELHDECVNESSGHGKFVCVHT
jgi:hypothetical protein